MTRYSKLNIVYRLQKWMDSVPGQTFLNYAYSWGASIVVLGALLKLIHICLLYTSPSPRDSTSSRMPSSA